MVKAYVYLFSNKYKNLIRWYFIPYQRNANQDKILLIFDRYFYNQK